MANDNQYETLNNNLNKLFEKFDEMTKELSKLVYFVRGVDGQNGLHSKVIELEAVNKRQDEQITELQKQIGNYRYLFVGGGLVLTAVWAIITFILPLISQK